MLDTVFTSDGSPVWHGIEYGLELLKKGVVWRLGNGKSIQILRDNWIPRQSGLSIQSMKTRSRLRWVNQLLLPHSNDWNKQIIDKLFYNFDSEEIYKIKLPPKPMGAF